MEYLLDHLDDDGFSVRNSYSENYWKERAERAENKLEVYQLVESYAKDVVDFWPSMSMRTIRTMIPKMDALKEALAMVKK